MLLLRNTCSKCVYILDFLMTLTLSWRGLLSYRNQSIDLQIRSMDWFLYDNGLRHERVKSYDFNAKRRIVLKWLNGIQITNFVPSGKFVNFFSNFRVKVHSIHMCNMANTKRENSSLNEILRFFYNNLHINRIYLKLTISSNLYNSLMFQLTRQ